MKVKPVLYRLTKSVFNPDRDKRYSSGFNAFVSFPQGTLVIFTPETHRPDKNYSINASVTLVFSNGHGVAVPYGKISGFINEFAPIEPATARTVEEVLHVEGFKSFSSVALLQHMVDKGALTLEDLAAHVESLYAKWDAEEEGN